MKARRDIHAWEKIIKNSIDLICTIDRNGDYVNFNEACKSTLGYEREELIGRHFSNLVHPDDLVPTLNSLEGIHKGNKVKNFKNRGIHKNGQEVHISWSAVWSEEEHVALCIGRDVTEQEVALQKDCLNQALINHSSDMLALFDEESNFLYAGTSTLRELGYHPEQLIGKNALGFIHPDDIPVVKDALEKALLTRESIVVSEFRFKNAKGEWRWLETRGSNQLHNPSVKALVTSSRDITERIHNRFRLQESEQRFKSLYDHHLDMVFFQNKEGVVIDVNAATLYFFGVSKQFFLGRKLSDLLSPEMEIIEKQLPPEILNLQKETLQRALKGESVRFEAELPFAGKGIYHYDVAKIPVSVNGEIVGVYTILRDITEIKESNKTIERQAEKLINIMESITEAFHSLDKDWNFTYVNREFERLFGVDRNELLGKNLWNYIDGSIQKELSMQFQYAVGKGKAAHFEIFSEKDDKWLEIKAYPSEEGLSIFINDITERVKAKKELEKLSLVASKTTNGVVITDAEGLVEWVNESFTNLTEYTLPEVEGKNLRNVLFGDETDQATALRLRESRKQGKPFSGELLNYKKSGEKIWFALEVTPIKNEAGEVIKYTSIQTDITYRKEAEASQLQLTRDLFRQNQDLQQFTYIVSHNLRSPVANVMGLINILTTTDMGSDTFEVSLGYLNKSVHQLDAVLRDLNMILSIRDNRDGVDYEMVSLSLVVQQVITNFQDSLKACGGEVWIDMDDQIFVRGNKAYLYSVFFNLLSNAIKYRSPKRKLKVDISCVRSTENETVICFSDNGLGFDMELAGDKVFQLYKRFHSSSEGRGVGLFLIKTHLEAMGGHIEVSSQVGVGTKFLICLK